MKRKVLQNGFEVVLEPAGSKWYVEVWNRTRLWDLKVFDDFRSAAKHFDSIQTWSPA